MKRIATALCIMALLLSSLAYAAGESEEARIPANVGMTERLQTLGFQVWRPDTPAPSFTLRDLAEHDVSLEDFRGSIVLLNFWATWCPPCRAEMPSMETLYRRMAGRDFVMLAVDLQERPSQVRRFVEAAGYSFPVLLDSSGRTGAVYQVSGIPTTYIIDKEGNVLARTVGGRKWHTPEIIALFDDLVK
jgi:peroxiredoxin